MEIKHDAAAGRFDMYDDAGAHVGEIEYKHGGNQDLYATHTEVFPPNEGKGYARMLLDALVEYATENGYKIVPICPYVIAAFRKSPEKYAAVMKH